MRAVPNTVTAEGHARAHDPRIDTMRMSMTPDLGIFAPLKMPCAWPEKIHIMRMRIYPKILNFKDTAFVYSFFWSVRM